MKRLLFILVILPLVCYAGRECRFISTNGKEVKLKKVSRAEVDAVKIYLMESEIPADAERIGVILNGAKRQEDALIQSKKLAARAGGKAIYLQSGKEISGGQKMVNTFLWSGAFKAKWVFYVYR